MTAFVPQVSHDCRDLIRIFNECFERDEATCLIGGASEPLYTPAGKGQPAKIFFSHDYFASALHEVAHWCVAGLERRKQEDYGYWYAPDGRSAEQQAEFERVEARPQALEWVFSAAAVFQFRVSADNLNLGLGPSEEFKDAIFSQLQHLNQQGLAPRAARFTQALLNFYRPGVDLPWLFESSGSFARDKL
ncbi:elongation factor P hydroxylase [Gilvimarinus sp. DA14]|uniref:elongation factor P hydroxylase n=1 Tax=Gilvimarinus sp. DA14 TaxID=2956798 RepID=UPI0020B7FC9B|nr:elongation factor P hydroxylase [Gilvimarinus sp. DA14]UTF61377.1 elongation factor P hydroxylase [Gilvimarinus sp. DA14]